ncbi:MAG: hypothetical protein U5R31_07515 [Acidimicrobiia bacterium]|nr:hypothetical protein [Acidimicrobiia bacterium]
MAIGRNPESDIMAIAAMPGLEKLAAALAPETDREDAMSILVYTRRGYAVGSGNKVTSLFRTTDRWDDAVASAVRVERTLPAKAPTQDKLRHCRDRTPDMGRRLADAFPAAMAPLVRAAGMLPADTPPTLHRPNRANVVYGDGSVLRPLSDVDVDRNTGEILGSRAKIGGKSRRAETHVGKNGGDAGRGVPFTPPRRGSGGIEHQRVVLGVDLNTDCDEVGSALGLFDRAVDIYGQAIHGFVYDLLFSGSAHAARDGSHGRSHRRHAQRFPRRPQHRDRRRGPPCRVWPKGTGEVPRPRRADRRGGVPPFGRDRARRVRRPRRSARDSRLRRCAGHRPAGARRTSPTSTTTP